jgi:hypothetical protein
MSDLDILNEMIKETAKMPLSTEYGKPCVRLIEPQATDSSVTICGLPPSAMVIKADTFQPPDSIFCGSKGECKRADYVIIADTGDKKRILYIEMKKTKGTRQDIISQLHGAKCFIHYCQEIGKTFWGETDFMRDFHARYVSFGHTSIPKKKTRIDRSTGTNTTPETMMKVDWPGRQQFNHLVGA